MCGSVNRRVYRGKITARLSLLIIMSSKRPSETNRMRDATEYIKRKLFQSSLSRAPTPSSIEMDSSSGNRARWVMEFFFPTFHWNYLGTFKSISPLDIDPVMSANTSPGLPVSVSAPKQFGSASGQRLETPPIVSDHTVLAIVAANDRSFSRCLWPPVDHHCKYPGNQSNTSL